MRYSPPGRYEEIDGKNHENGSRHAENRGTPIGAKTPRFPAHEPRGRGIIRHREYTCSRIRIRYENI